MNQRAQFAHQAQGKKTWLTEERIQLLDDLGFIWDPHHTSLKKRNSKVMTTGIDNNDDRVATPVRRKRRHETKADVMQ